MINWMFFRNCNTTAILAAMRGKLGVEGRQEVSVVCHQGGRGWDWSSLNLKKYLLIADDV